MYEMKPEYYIGIDMIDEEHKQIFKYADEAYELLHDEFTVDKYDKIDVILEKLRNYTVKHFTDEEHYMESINYKNYSHKKSSISNLSISWMNLWINITKIWMIRTNRLWAFYNILQSGW